MQHGMIVHFGGMLVDIQEWHVPFLSKSAVQKKLPSSRDLSFQTQKAFSRTTFTRSNNLEICSSCSTMEITENNVPSALKWLESIESDGSDSEPVGLVPHNRGYKHILFFFGCTRTGMGGANKLVAWGVDGHCLNVNFDYP